MAGGQFEEGLENLKRVAEGATKRLMDFHPKSGLLLAQWTPS